MALKWGIAGSGKISNDFVAAMRFLDEKEHKVVAVAARSVSSAAAFATKHNIPKFYGSYNELANDPDIDVVYIGCVSSQHYPLGKLMLESGKHLLVEKPMTLSLKQTKALKEIASRKKRFLMEALWSRFLPSYKFLIGLIGSGVIGEVLHVRADLGFPMLHPGFRRGLGAGTLLDLGVYPLNAVCMIYSGEKPITVAAVGHLNDDGIDIAMTCSLLYSGNRTATITTSGIAELMCELVITGSLGVIKVPQDMYVAKVIKTHEETYEFPIPDQKVPCNYPNCSGLMYEMIEVRKCIEKGDLQSPIMSIGDSETMIEIMDTIRQQLGVSYPSENDI